MCDVLGYGNHVQCPGDSIAFAYSMELNRRRKKAYTLNLVVSVTGPGVNGAAVSRAVQAKATGPQADLGSLTLTSLTTSDTLTPSLAPTAVPSFTPTPSPTLAPVPQPPCSGRQTFTEAQRTLTDGPVGLYAPNRDCEFLITPPGTGPVVMTFTQFSTEENYDFVRVYDGMSTGAPLLADLTGAMPAVNQYTATSGAALIKFVSDGDVEDSGWAALYVRSQPIASLAPMASPLDVPPSDSLLLDYVVAHNAKRTPAGLPAVVYSSTVEAFAQSWADTLQSQGCSMQHSTNAQRSGIAHGAGTGVGENLYWAMGMTPTWASIVDSWWEEIDNYAYGPSGNSCAQPGGVVGHFTQVAWQCSVYVGCAMATCGSQTIAVCNYGITGNMVNDLPFSSSVSAALGKSGTPCAAGGQAQTCAAPSSPSTLSTPSTLSNQFPVEEAQFRTRTLTAATGIGLPCGLVTFDTNTTNSKACTSCSAAVTARCLS